MDVQSRFEPSGLGPFQNYFQIFSGGLDKVTETFEPVAKGMARCQLETMGLMSRRAQAQLDLASRLTRCRSPVDVMSEGAQFWQTAFQQYADSSRQIMAAWMQMTTEPMARAAHGAGTGQRDYITFPEAGDQGDEGPRDSRQRKAA